MTEVAKRTPLPPHGMTNSVQYLADGHCKEPPEGSPVLRRDDAPNGGSANLYTSALAGLDPGVGGVAGGSVGRHGEDPPSTVCLRVGVPDGAPSHLGVVAR